MFFFLPKSRKTWRKEKGSGFIRRIGGSIFGVTLMDLTGVVRTEERGKRGFEGLKV